MPKATYWIRRSKRHVALAAIAILITFLAYAATPPPDVRHRLSMATAYAGLIFLAASLWIGPWNVLRRRPNPVSFDLRRDVGIWTGILAILHNSRLDCPSPGTNVDVLFQEPASIETAKYAIRLRQPCRTRCCTALLDAFGDLQ